MNISTTFLNALKHTSSDVEGQRSPEILLGQIYKVSLEDKGFLLPLAGGEFRLLNPFYYEWNPFPSYLLLYTLEGSALLATQGSEVVLDHEHLLFLDCSQGFSLRLLQGKWRFQMFFLSGRELSSYYSIFEANFTCCYPIPIGSCVSQRMQQLTKFPFTPTPAEQLQIHRELTGMFTELALSALSVSRDAKPIPAYLLSMKADFLLSLCELVVGGKDGLQPIEKTVIDRCVRLIYRDMALGLGDGKPPLLQDLYEELLKQPEPEARRVATALELYCTGSLNLFNHQTNVKLTAHIVCIVLKGLGENLRKIAMHVTNDFVTSAVNVNFHNGVSTWCYFDEFHILLRDALTASYFVAVWKMLRKKGCVPSALTQNVKDLLASREIEAILDNTDFMILLSQAQSDRAILAKQLGISEHQLSYITHSNSGEGLLFYGDVTIPFVDRFPKGEIYNLLTTRPEDLKNEAKTE